MIDKIVFWNIRSVNTQKVFTRLITLQKRYHFIFIGLMEPFQVNKNIEKYRKRLEIQSSTANSSEKYGLYGLWY